MAEETAKQLRCITIYRLLKHRVVVERPTTFVEDNPRNWFVSEFLACMEAERRRGSQGLRFEITPYPSLAFRFDSKWLFVVREGFRGFYVEHEGQTLSCKFSRMRKPLSIHWKGKTSSQLQDFFSSITMDPYDYDQVGISALIRHGIIEIKDPIPVKRLSYMADADQESFITRVSRSEGWNEKLCWPKTSFRHWSKSHEEAKKLDLELKKFFPALS